jgi:uncharacterized protein (TIGR00297 family)
MGLDLLGGVLVSAPVALLAWRARALTFGGAAAGFFCAVAIYLGAYLAGIAVLGVALLLTVVSTRLGRKRQVARGLADEAGGRRGARNVLANCAVGAIAGLLAAFSAQWSGEAGSLMLVTAIAAGASDTVASEVGEAFGGRPRAFPTFRSVSPGTPGAVTLVGTLAGVVAAAIIAAPAVILWLLPADRIPLIVAACTAGAFVESALATRFESRGVLDNNALNVLNTACAAALAVWGAG